MQDTFSRCNPIVNLIFYLGAIIFGMIFMHPLCLMAAAVTSITYYIYLKRIGGLKVLLGLAPVFIIISAINPLFNTRGETLLFSIGTRPYTLEALIYGVAVATMFICVILWFFTYNIVITSDKLTYLLGNIIPSLSLVFTMVFRLLPSYKRKLVAISNARKCIGKYGENGGTKDRIKNGTTVVSTLTSWALENSIVTADSMKSRGYGSSKRSNFVIYRFTSRDIWILVLMIICIVTISFCGIKGGMSYTFIPDIDFATNKFTVVGVLFYFIFLSLPIIIDVTEDVVWHFLKSRI